MDIDIEIDTIDMDIDMTDMDIDTTDMDIDMTDMDADNTDKICMDIDDADSHNPMLRVKRPKTTKRKSIEK